MVVYMAHRRKTLVVSVVAAALCALLDTDGWFVISALFVGLGLVVQRRPRLVADENGITVAGLTRTSRVPWTDVRGMRMVWFGVSKCLLIERQNGRAVRSWVFTDDPGTGYQSAELQRLLRELAERQETAQGGTLSERPRTGGLGEDLGFVLAVPDRTRAGKAVLRTTYAMAVLPPFLFVGLGISLLAQGHPPGVIYFGVGLIVIGFAFGAWMIRMWRQARAFKTRIDALVAQVGKGSVTSDAESR